MNHTDDEVIRAAIQRIAQIFQVPFDEVRKEHVFGTDLTTSGGSDFEYGELDQVLHDVQDAAHRQTPRKIATGELVIRTVGDYCDHMVNCYRSNEKEVINILGLGGGGG